MTNDAPAGAHMRTPARRNPMQPSARLNPMQPTGDVVEVLPHNLLHRVERQPHNLRALVAGRGGEHLRRDVDVRGRSAGVGPGAGACQQGCFGVATCAWPAAAR